MPYSPDLEVARVFRIPLRVEGISMLDDAVAAAISEDLSDHLWSSRGDLVTAEVFLDRASVDAVCDVSHAIEHTLTDSRVTHVDDELVGISDIAVRVGVSRETVRSWVLGSRRQSTSPFPSARGYLGTAKVWFWRHVNTWLGQLHLDDGTGSFSEKQIAEINAHLQRVSSLADKNWQALPPQGKSPAYRSHVSTAAGVSFVVAHGSNELFRAISVDPVPTETYFFGTKVNKAIGLERS